jgi:hypothetical protein
MLTITIGTNIIEKLTNWLHDFPEEIDAIESISEHKFITDWDVNKCYIEKRVKENALYQMIQHETEDKYACIIPNYIHKMTFKINNFTFEVINSIIELRKLGIEYELYDSDKNKVEYQELFDWKEDLIINTYTPKNVLTDIERYCDSFILGVFLMVLALIFYAFT